METSAQRTASTRRERNQTEEAASEGHEAPRRSEGRRRHSDTPLTALGGRKCAKRPEKQRRVTTAAVVWPKASKSSSALLDSHWLVDFQVSFHFQRRRIVGNGIGVTEGVIV